MSKEQRNSGQYVKIEASYPHGLLLHLNQLLNGELGQLLDEKKFLESYRNSYPDQEYEWQLLELAYQDNILARFWENYEEAEWKKRVFLETTLYQLVKKIPEYAAVELLESLLFVFQWEISTKVRRTWPVKQKEKSTCHDRMKLRTEDIRKKLDQIKAGIYEEEYIAERPQKLDIRKEESKEAKDEERPADVRDRAHEKARARSRIKKARNTEKKSEDWIVPVDEQRPDQVRFYAIMSLQCRKVLRRALSGDAQSQCEMGDYYAEKNSGHTDYKEAIRWYEVAAQKGCDRAYFAMGRLYDGSGSKIEGSKEKAFEIYHKLGMQGFPTAQYIIGMKYWFGDGIDESISEAIAWFTKAAKQQHEGAIRNLGNLYDSIHDAQNSRKWYEVGAKLGDTYCKNKL